MRDDTRPIDIPADPAAALTNLPGLLGHHISEHLVLLQRGPGARPGPILMRTLAGVDDLVDLFHRTGALLDPYDGPLDILVISRSWPRGLPEEEAVRAALGPEVVVGGYAGVAAIAAGEPVTLRDGTPAGVVQDPALSWTALALSQAGEAISPDLAALDARFTPEDDPGRTGPAAEALDLARRDIARLAARYRSIGEEGAARQLLTWYDDWDRLLRDLRDRGAGIDEVLGRVGDLRVLARALINLTVRDLTIDVIACADAPLARVLWLECARLFTGTARANALACYALDRWFHGCPGIAERALDAARAADPEHTLTALLDRAISVGRGGEAATSMIRAAERLHVALGVAGYGVRPGDAGEGAA